MGWPGMVLGLTLCAGVIAAMVMASGPGNHGPRTSPVQHAVNASTTVLEHAAGTLPVRLRPGWQAFNACWIQRLNDGVPHRKYRRSIQNWSDVLERVWAPCVPIGVDTVLMRDGGTREDQLAMQAWFDGVRPKVQQAWQAGQAQVTP